MSLGRLSVFVSALVCLLASACAGRRAQPPVPFPTEPDLSRTYCLCWVPPTYRDVPTLVKCREGCVECKTVWRKDVEFHEVCTPGTCRRVTGPDVCREHQIIQRTPPHVDWCGMCPDECGCACWRPVQVPGTYQCCEKTWTENGIEYCYQRPPQYDVVAHEVMSCVQVPKYNPADWRVVWTKEEFQPGRWEWHARCGGPCPPPGCQPPPVCCPAPQPTCGCTTGAPSCGATTYGTTTYGPTTYGQPTYGPTRVVSAPPATVVPRKGDFSYAPPPN